MHPITTNGNLSPFRPAPRFRDPCRPNVPPLHRRASILIPRRPPRLPGRPDRDDPNPPPLHRWPAHDPSRRRLWARHGNPLVRTAPRSTSPSRPPKISRAPNSPPSSHPAASTSSPQQRQRTGSTWRASGRGHRRLCGPAAQSRCGRARAFTATRTRRQMRRRCSACWIGWSMSG
jgi:hypothetical protein